MPLPNGVKYSIIIPAYNHAQSLVQLLDQLIPQTDRQWEIIVIDDASTDETAEQIKRFPVRYFRLPRNQGPAKARNFGAKQASGEILIFFDADVWPYENTLTEVERFFQTHPHAQAVSGMWSKNQNNPSFFAQYKALRDWSYFFNEASRKNIYYFTPRVAAIKKKAFLSAGGFDTHYKKADMEDLEFGFRLEKNTPIFFDPKFIVRHDFLGGLVQIKNYFKRTYYFLCLFWIYRRFCRTVSTPKEGLTVMLSALVFLSLLGTFIAPALGTIFSLSLIIYLWVQRRFLRFFYQERGGFFTLRSFLFNFLLHLTVFAAFCFFLLKLPWQISRKNLYEI